jgi:hypothetical protein
MYARSGLTSFVAATSTRTRAPSCRRSRARCPASGTTSRPTSRPNPAVDSARQHRCEYRTHHSASCSRRPRRSGLLPSSTYPPHSRHGTRRRLRPLQRHAPRRPHPGAELSRRHARTAAARRCNLHPSPGRHSLGETPGCASPRRTRSGETMPHRAARCPHPGMATRTHCGGTRTRTRPCLCRGSRSWSPRSSSSSRRPSASRASLRAR